VTQLHQQHQQLGRQNRIPQCRLVVYSSEHDNEALLAKAAAATLGGSAGLPLEVTRRIVTERGKGRTFQAPSLARRTVKEQSSTTFMEPTVLPIGHGSEIPVQRLPSRPWRLATRRGPTPDGCGAGRGRRLSCSIVCSVRMIGSFVSPPATFRLGEPIRDDVEGFKIVAVSEVAAVHVNVLRARRRKAGAALPGSNRRTGPGARKDTATCCLCRKSPSTSPTTRVWMLHCRNTYHREADMGSGRTRHAAGSVLRILAWPPATTESGTGSRKERIRRMWIPGWVLDRTGSGGP
jgi:hypothetical protein